ncbi:hypothetical protein, partial [Escherichia coli]|uniref:hypothetical protein n=1 Tax=Escherichia coli TaxID=562 RepID=UPI00192A44E9
FLSACTRSGGKANVADFAGDDLRGWCGAPAKTHAILVRRGGRMGLERKGIWTEAISRVAAVPATASSPPAQALRQRMEERLHALATYPLPRPNGSERVIPFTSDTARQHGQISRLAAILWQGLKREIRTAVTAI